MASRKLHTSQDCPSTAAFQPDPLLLPPPQPGGKPSSIPFGKLLSLKTARHLLQGLQFVLSEGVQVRYALNFFKLPPLYSDRVYM